MAKLLVPGYTGIISTPFGDVEVVNGEATFEVDRTAADADVPVVTVGADDKKRRDASAKAARRNAARRNVDMLDHFIARGYAVAEHDGDPARKVAGGRRNTASGQPRAAAASKEQDGIGAEVGPVSTLVTEPGDGPNADQLAAQVAGRKAARGT